MYAVTDKDASCGGLIGPYRLIYLNAWTLVGGMVWGRIRKLGFVGEGV